MSGIGQGLTCGSLWSLFLCMQLGVVSPFAGDCLRQTGEYSKWQRLWRGRKGSGWFGLPRCEPRGSLWF